MYFSLSLTYKRLVALFTSCITLYLTIWVQLILAMLCYLCIHCLFLTWSTIYREIRSTSPRWIYEAEVPTVLMNRFLRPQTIAFCSANRSVVASWQLAASPLNTNCKTYARARPLMICKLFMNGNGRYARNCTPWHALVMLVYPSFSFSG